MMFRDGIPAPSEGSILIEGARRREPSGRSECWSRGTPQSRRTLLRWGDLESVPHDTECARGSEERVGSFAYDIGATLHSAADSLVATGECASLPELLESRLYEFSYDPQDRVDDMTIHHPGGVVETRSRRARNGPASNLERGLSRGGGVITGG